MCGCSKNPKIAACCSLAYRPDVVSAAERLSEAEQWDSVRKPLLGSAVQCDWSADVSVAAAALGKGDIRRYVVSAAFGGFAEAQL
jgi:hypothetical protein